MWEKLKAFALAVLGMQSFGEGNLELSEDDQKKLDAAAKQEGFAEKFMAKYNDNLEAQNASDAIDAFMAEQGIEASAEGEDGENDPETDEELPKASKLDARLNALMKEHKVLKASNEEMAGNIAKLEKLPDSEEAPETLNAKIKGKVIRHSKTHLFASNESYDAFEDRPWNRAAKQAMAGQPITAETQWNETANIDKLNTDIQDYFRKESNQITDLMLDGFKMPKYVEMISGVSDEYLHTQIITGEITQSLKKKFLPKNKVKFEAEKGKVRDIQIDMLFKGYELKKLEKSYLKNFAQLGIVDSNPHKERFVMYVVRHILKRARKEDKIVTGRGVYFADPDRDTPASFINNFSGFLKLYKDARGKKYKPFDLSDKFSGGKPTPVNIYDYVNEMVERLPYEFRIQPDLIFKLSPYWLSKYNDARERIKGTNTNYVGESQSLDNYANIELVAYDQMEGEDFMYIIPQGLEYMLTDKPGEDGFIQFQKGGATAPRDWVAYGDYKLAAYVAGFGRKEYDMDALDFDNQMVFSNDVEVLVNSYVPVAENNSTPSLEHHSSLIIGSNNTAATNITNLTESTPGERVYLLGDASDFASTVKNNANIILDAGDFKLEKGNLLVLQTLEGGKFIELSRREKTGKAEKEQTILAPDATTADAVSGTDFVTSANTQATELESIENAVSGERYTLTGGSSTNATTVTSGGNFFLNGDMTLEEGKYITVEYTGSKFVEIARG